MCSTIYFTDPLYGKIKGQLPHGALATVKEIRDFGWIVVNSDFEDWDEGACLCGVDVEAILNRATVKWKAEPWGYEVASL